MEIGPVAAHSGFEQQTATPPGTPLSQTHQSSRLQKGHGFGSVGHALTSAFPRTGGS